MATRSVSVLLLALAACGGGGPAPSSPENASANGANSTPPQSAVATAPDPAPLKTVTSPPLEATPPTVRLVSSGTAPRKRLHYAFATGKSEFMVAEVSMTFATARAGDQLGDLRKMPTFRIVMKLDVAEVLPDGSAKVRANVERMVLLRDEDSLLDERARTRMEQVFGSLVGIKGHATLSQRGVPSDMGFDLPPNSDENLKGMFDMLRVTFRELFVLLPEEEVGANATWDVIARMPNGTLMADVKRTYTVKELKADSARMDVALTASAPLDQPLSSEHPGVTARLDSFKGNGAGKAVVAFGHLVGERELEQTQDMTSTVSDEHERLTIEGRSVSKIVIRPAKAAPANNAAKPKTK